jgi:hypothetical protein
VKQGANRYQENFTIFIIIDDFSTPATQHDLWLWVADHAYEPSLLKMRTGVRRGREQKDSLSNQLPISHVVQYPPIILGLECVSGRIPHGVMPRLLVLSMII